MIRVLAIGILLLAGCVTAPPVQEMSDARQAISAAELADTDRVATDTLDDARRFLAEAERQIHAMLDEAFRVRGEIMKDKRVIAVEHTTERIGCALAAITLLSDGDLV